MMWSYGMGWVGWAVMTGTALVFWALIVVAIVALFRSRRGPDHREATPPERSAERVLDERFAKGDITAEEYQARRTLLRERR